MKDKELDNLMRAIAREAALDDAAVDEIAYSQTLWRSVQNEIRRLEPAKAPWPPSFLRKWLMAVVPVAAAILVGVVLYGVSTRSSRTGELANATESERSSERETATTTPPIADRDLVQPASVQIAEEPSTKTLRRRPAEHEALRKVSAKVPTTLTARAQSDSATEIKTDFIALAYAREPESGQLVRVKVPSSMMVTLGVVPTVANPSALVNAEVVVGDDGLTRSIRFIRQ